MAAEQAGRALRFLFFWGHQPQKDGSVGAGCLSQWWPAGFTVDGITYATAEHYMMAHKAWLFGDEDTARRILRASHPKEAKDLGRKALGFDPATWEAARREIVRRGNQAKFSQHRDLADYLVTTRSRVLVEASPRDRIWGIGMAASHEHAASPSHWRGPNLLGFALMDVRDALLAS